MPLPEESNPYLRKFGCRVRSIAEAPSSALALVVVIPCHDEPDLIGSLDALQACQPAGCDVECLVVVNDSENAAENIRKRNIETLSKARQWKHAKEDASFRLHLIESLNQPRKQAGVGLARKIGMDEAVRRLELSDVGADGVIICFDADCRCDPTFLREMNRHFQEHPETPGCSVYFAHPLNGPSQDSVAAIVSYELHLRYYINALRFAGYPRAYQTVGSSMAVRSWAYQKQGGMNTRQAGEDFYFLHRIIELGGFTELLTTRVLPSPRPSHRVPFGTGRAVAQLLDQSEPGYQTYPFQSFLDLGQLLPLAMKLRLMPPENVQNLLSTLPSPLKDFLDQQDFLAELTRMRTETTNDKTYFRRFFSWFNAFRVMKYIHHARDNAYGTESVAGATTHLLHRLECLPPDSHVPSEGELLATLRKLDRQGWKNAPSSP